MKNGSRTGHFNFFCRHLRKLFANEQMREEKAWPRVHCSSRPIGAIKSVLYTVQKRRPK